ncbi:hypothetical protein AVEN_195169-1 [Araneus ventricosus]|uniref:Uncharacterized protein n=1 Tax=Araneus ventricosus TaxID=182803 RepID=A0A4Y2T9J0_ARAVE|nr:hypothetical protein AVEN_195169-1 [Araneus ventricosus]
MTKHEKTSGEKPAVGPRSWSRLAQAHRTTGTKASPNYSRVTQLPFQHKPGSRLPRLAGHWRYFARSQYLAHYVLLTKNPQTDFNHETRH